MASPQSDTPRTDKMIPKLRPWLVNANFARSLERQAKTYRSIAERLGDFAAHAPVCRTKDRFLHGAQDCDCGLRELLGELDATKGGE